MVLNPEKWEVSVPESFYGVVIEVKVGHLKLLGTWHALPRSPDCKSVILAGNQDPSGRQIQDRMIASAMSVGKLLGLRPERQGEQLMPQADAESGQARPGQLPDRIQHVLHGRWVAGAVREEEAVGIQLANSGR